ncbi:pyridoxamine 5'-phosphate oxidase [Micavibrio aeruginosavorus]|nr:pyridoxamine 5'-phosphate oxidase [Micavibrio aeruginosavorus]
MDTFDNLENANQAPADPFALFSNWMAQATASEPNDPNAMALATVDGDGMPSVRMVLLKDYDQRGFVFYTNGESRKGNALTANPVAGFCIHWKSLRRQIRAEGRVERVSDAESDAYFHSRSRESQLAAAASDQSRPLDHYSALETRVKTLEELYDGTADIPRPAHWGGYRIIPTRIEFWQDGPHRMHHRVAYTRDGDDWVRSMLYP